MGLSFTILMANKPKQKELATIFSEAIKKSHKIGEWEWKKKKKGKMSSKCF